ncbi:1,4-dihydroxy-2-naphthoate octaprenyltransferase [Longilinea arvoryzae]|uniref:1,4-dihydroxy-2-naphthoate octaprenyltransferase n=1 Tax=Longilinea arvoryzae TaxID=360412 RepID=A0A0S7B660_9CHLR|nr:prenyltransferase [Longilinea arvoryzae]GAP12636.1 1,4-dihydroxy-2-naphthoate octaprenyltransferase [Longilinea arvoryzae]
MQASTFRSRIWDFIRLTRVVFLFGGFLLYALGAATAARAGLAILWPAYLLGQIVVTSIQLSAHYGNEYYDREVDRLAAQNRTWFSGGSGMLATGSLSPSTVRVAAYACVAVALATGILAGIRSPWMFAIVALSLAGSWFYSAPPLTLMSSGWGELTTSLIVAVGVPLAGYLMQAGLLPAQFWPVYLPLLLLHGAMLIAFEIPDFSVDRSLGKKTLTVRLGPPRAAGLAGGLIVCAYLLLAILALSPANPGRWMVWTLPLAIIQMLLLRRAARAPTRIDHFLLTAGGACLFTLTALLALLGMLFAGLGLG